MTAENTTDATNTPDTIVLVHGFWVTPRSWEKWVEHYEERGYRVLTPAYPGFEVEVEALREDPSPIEALTFPAIIEHIGGIIDEMDKPAEGVKVVPVSQIRSLFPFLSHPSSRHKAMGFTKEQWHYAFTNTMSREESDEVYDRYHIPASGRLVWVGATANFTPGHQEDYVNFKNEDRPPLLFIAGSEDNLMPPAVNQSNVKHYRHAKSPTDYKEFEGRSHYSVIGGEGWEEVADYALEWAEANATAQHTPRLAT
jgi:pimeloyl-ACP methyl ester carboxylesterase